MLGQGFNVQPDGQYALAATCANAGPWTTIVWDDTPLLTTFASSALLTACVPHWLLARAGSHRILLRDQYLGQSEALDFRVVP